MKQPIKIRSMEKNAALRKDVSNLIRCRISDCCISDVFLTGTMGNQGFYKKEGFLLGGKVQVKSINGPKRISVDENSVVYRKKRLVEELDGSKCDLSMFGIEKTEKDKVTTEEKTQSNKLVDLFGGCSTENDIISLLF